MLPGSSSTGRATRAQSCMRRWRQARTTRPQRPPKWRNDEAGIGALLVRGPQALPGSRNRSKSAFLHRKRRRHRARRPAVARTKRVAQRRRRQRTFPTRPDAVWQLKRGRTLLRRTAAREPKGVDEVRATKRAGPKPRVQQLRLSDLSKKRPNDFGVCRKIAGSHFDDVRQDSA